MNYVFGFTYVLTVLLIGLSANISHTNGQLELLATQFMRHGTECILEQQNTQRSAKGKGNINRGRGHGREELVDKIVNMDENVIQCFSTWKKYLEKESELSQPHANTKEENNKRIETTVRIYCSAANGLMSCLQPTQEVFKNCKRIEGTAVGALLNLLCEYDGKRTTEFIQSKGLDCIFSPVGESLTSEAKLFAKCVQSDSTNSTTAYVQKNICKAASHVNGCVLESLNWCENFKAKSIFRKFNSDLKERSPEAGICFNKNSKISTQSILGTEAGQDTSGRRMSKKWKKRISRPKYTW